MDKSGGKSAEIVTACNKITSEFIIYNFHQYILTDFLTEALPGKIKHHPLETTPLFSRNRIEIQICIALPKLGAKFAQNTRYIVKQKLYGTLQFIFHNTSKL